ncbi:hypothetical protein BGX34_001621 [Mortierella sp. NVP85]|nr:hypothetical protein BGX34_001621 [Mortierella sp. NVP85]
MAVFGLSISALSIVLITDKVSLSVFWVYQFVAECVAVTWVITTIIHLGYAFYPLTRHQTLIWRTALGSVILYDLVAVMELTYYCYAVWGSGTLAREATPVLWIYWVRQLVKVISCSVTIAYLFVPLVRHRHTAGMSMIADSNTLAVGTWYLSALGITSVGYIAMVIYYMTKPDTVFSPQAQSLDLCIRLSACPIFSLPPPPILLKYFQRKYGANARDANPNIVIDESITNNPRPRRPPLLVNQPTSHLRRGNTYEYDYPTYQGRRNQSFHSPLSELDEIRCKRFMEEEPNVATTSSLGTATESSPKFRALSTNSSSLQKEAQTPTTVVADDSAHSVSISIPLKDARSTPSIREATTPPSSFALGIDIDRDEDEETAIAARKISRRLTMEGRNDELDFLNIGGLIKWPYRPSSATLAPHMTLETSSGNSSFTLLPALVPGSSLRHSRSLSDVHNRSASPSGTQGDRQSRISNNSTDGEYKDAKEKQETNVDTDFENHMDLSDVRTDVYYRLKAQEDLNSADLLIQPTLSERESLHPNRASNVGRKLSMDNIRQKSRHALTRLQGAGLGTALSSPVCTGPLSPTILRTTHGTSTEEPRLNSPKSLSNTGDVAPYQHQHTRPQQVHSIEPMVDPRNEAEGS